MKKLMLLALCAGCSGVDSPVDSEATWTVDHRGDDALLGVWGHGPDDVWAVGGTIERPLVMHNDGTAWSQREVPGSSRLWNVYGFSATDVYAVGERGLILHYDGQTWTRVPSGTDVTLFGLWGASGDDVWIVGGNVASSEPAVVLRGARESFTPVTDLPADLSSTTLFKVHGFSPDDVLVVGESGVLRWNGTAWRHEDVPTNAPLRSTWGRDASDVYAVGGRGVGEILKFDGSTWSLIAELPIGLGLSGVFTAPDEPTLAVGDSYVFEVGHDGSVVQALLPDSAPTSGLHGVWGDGAGTAYAVGGNLSSSSMNGVILRRR